MVAKPELPKDSSPVSWDDFKNQLPYSIATFCFTGALQASFDVSWQKLLIYSAGFMIGAGALIWRKSAPNPWYICAGLLVGLVAAVVFPFVEQGRLPFTPVPTTSDLESARRALKEAKTSQDAQATQLNSLGQELQKANADGAKWRFAFELRNSAKASNGSRLSCTYSIGLAPSTGGTSWNTWTTLQPLLDAAWWQPHATGGTIPPGVAYPTGLTIRINGHEGDGFACGSALQRTLSDVYSYSAPLRLNQTTSALTACNNECVELDIGD